MDNKAQMNSGEHLQASMYHVLMQFIFNTFFPIPRNIQCFLFHFPEIT